MATKKPSQTRKPWFGWRSGLIFGLMLGAFLANLDRMERLRPLAHSATQLLPGYIRWVIPGFGAPYGQATADTELTGRIITVYDGDTATLFSEKENKKYKIRFYGIDAPEANQEFGRESGKMLRELIENQDVRVLVKNVDPYGRCVGRVFCEDLDVNLEMVRNGGAWYYRNYAPRELALQSAEVQAKAARKGLWSAAAPQPPWEYRKQEKKSSR